MMMVSPSIRASHGISEGISGEVRKKLARCGIAWSVLMLVYMDTASDVKSLAPKGSFGRQSSLFFSVKELAT